MNRYDIACHIELRQLRYFAGVAEMSSFAKAARALHISQPPLSRQIRSLEASMGVVLFNRSPKGVSLTAAGALFFVEVKRILNTIQNAAELVRREAQSTENEQIEMTKKVHL